ncbi:tetratricopeptide repeat protein [Nonomuraea sp. SMC257]|uniref:Tetratricopeptide repeat protein n=1 Tax=Nonomuraea montanisoli TaxID=2741721 RepID=A0A7Y6M2R8_9ACTN|nr:FxSxx-COOH system tetratricopeptide repeat protein [Nonomuraea montanisoli]NUW31670.1 tetratricopeptide repeat protein [Nonomuraea montanisoli]
MGDHTTPERAPEVWGKVPPRNRNFTGRGELLAQIRRGIGEVTAVVPLPQALHGLGGVGKTQLAIEYCWRYRGDYDVVWWITADQKALVPPALAALAPRLGVAHADTVGVDESAEAVREALERGDPYNRWLLVFDNADQPESVKGYIPANGHVLITSRNTRWDTAAETVSVNVFAREESVEFLTKRLPRIAPRDADRVADALGDLPLALEQASLLMAQTAISVEDYLDQLGENTRELLALGRPTEYPTSMTAAWRLSVTHLEARRPEAIDILRCCAFFGPEPIPRDVFRPGRGALPPRLGELLSSPIELSKSIGELNRFALARIDSDSRTLQVHRLIQALLRDDLEPEEQARTRHVVHRLLANGAPHDPDDDTTWPRWAELVGHLRPSLVADCEDDAVRGFAIRVIRYLYRRGDYRTAREIAEELLEKWTENSGPGDPDVLKVRRHLGNVLWQLGEYDASYTLNERTLALMRETLGAEDEETLGVFNTFGANLRARGEFTKAAEGDTASRELHEKVFGRDDPRTLRVIGNLALDYALTSDYPAARKAHEHAYLEQTSGAGGASRWDILNTMTGLARVVRLCGDFSDACDIGAEAYDYGRIELSPDHPLTLKAGKDLSIALRMAGRLGEARELAELTHSRLRTLFGPRNPDTLAAAVNLANALRRLGELEEAFRMTRDTVPRYAEIYGPGHPYTLGCRLNLALLYRLRDRPDEALAVNEEVREALHAGLGPHHDYTLSCTINLASDLAALGDHAAAERRGREVVRDLPRHFDEDHYITFSATHNLVLDLRALGREEEAGRLDAAMRARLHRDQRTSDHRREILERGRANMDFDPPPL